MPQDQTPIDSPVCWAVIFTSVRTKSNDGYAATAGRMLELAQSMPGFLGVDSAREDVGITVSYWESVEAIRAWREHPEHQAAQARGRKEWYASFTTRVCKVERESRFP
ncbi:antibiotic biosynthesis monooxygenase [uncultured Pseudodesulfovibrio sp.]|uniref:antibiotic biosynthesis monooxygenase family protein n=1 Tax=uncultured Pseudodesulfovibrio sp. TaxID=2035858 RepID=UPI0029C61E57|nr:antibiotic biosynthesis monooxygenase [uncultured Pseudodesulfovibrio sp.]